MTQAVDDKDMAPRIQAEALTENGILRSITGCPAGDLVKNTEVRELRIRFHLIVSYGKEVD